VELEGEWMERREKIKFLGYYITSDRDSHTDIKNRIALAKAVTNSMAEVWKSKELSTGLKLRLAIALIWSVARDCNPGLEFSIPGFGIVEFPIPGSRLDWRSRPYS